MQLGRPLPFILDTNSKRALEVLSRIGSGLGYLSSDERRGQISRRLSTVLTLGMTA